MFFRKLIFAFIILLFIGLAHAQMVSNVAGSTFFLNENFIKNNRIKSINGSISSKRDLQPIIQTGLEQFFEFYPNGKLYFSAETYFLGNGEKDTSITYFFYNNQGKIIQKRISDAGGFFSYHYEYDNNGELIKLTYTRDKNKGASKFDFIAEQSIIIYSETFENTKSQSMTKQVVYNDYGKQYKEIFLYYDNYKNLNEEQTVYSLTGKKSTTIYDYDGNGRVIKKSENADLFDKINNEWIYKYDITGNLTEEKFYKNGKAISTTEYLYDSKTMLLTARLTKDENTGTITIIKYTTVWRE